MAERIKGVDVSRYQGPVDWEAIASAGIRFAAARATIGNYYTDPTFGANWRGIKSAGIFRTAYHVLRPDNSAQSQMDLFLLALEGEPSDMPLALDVEIVKSGEDDDPFPPAQINSRVLQCAQILEKETDRKPIFYTAVWVVNHMLLDGKPPDFLGDYDLWVANYEVEEPILPAGWSKWRIWQYTQKGEPIGMPEASALDYNYFNGTEEDLADYALAGAAGDVAEVSVDEWALELDRWARRRGYAGPAPLSTS